LRPETERAKIPILVGCARITPPGAAGFGAAEQLPPGDSAVVAIADGKAMIALVADGQSCARLLAPVFILSMLVQVGRGENGTVGEAI